MTAEGCYAFAPEELNALFSPMPRTDDRGFTVVEVLVALAAAAMTLAAIANLAHGATRSGVRA